MLIQGFSFGLRFSDPLPDPDCWLGLSHDARAGTGGLGG